MHGEGASVLGGIHCDTQFASLAPRFLEFSSPWLIPAAYSASLADEAGTFTFVSFSV